MAKPVILAVDDDPQVLDAIQRDLRQHYRSGYRVLTAPSGPAALDAVHRLSERGTPVALVVSDERMPGMTGTQFLTELRWLVPDAGRVLLTAYADTEAAIRGINEAALHHYLLKPWDPPELALYPLLDDLLSDWSAHAHVPYDGIRVAGTRWSAPAFEVKQFLSRNNVPYQWVDIEQDATMQQLVHEVAGDDPARLPVVFFPDDAPLVAPTQAELAERVGLRTRATLPFYDLTIVGAGPAGLAAAVYASSEGLHTLLVEQTAPGGQAGTSSQIENYLGFPSGISGADLARRAAAQARRFGTEVVSAEVTAVRREDPFRVVRFADGVEVSSKALVLATGVAVRELDAPGVAGLTGRGVYYGAAMTEAATYRGQPVCIIGAGNSAGQGALFFARYASHVTMLVRGPSLSASMSHYLVERIEADPNIEVLHRVKILEVFGEDRLERVRILDADSGEEREVDCSAVFIFIGAAPHTSLVADLVALDEKGFVVTGPDLLGEGRRPEGWHLDRDPFLFETSVPGLFAVGDIRSGSSKRVAAAVGEGSATVSMVHRHLEAT
jgi:thioredoxin reductase (NADPH)